MYIRDIRAVDQLSNDGWVQARHDRAQNQRHSVAGTGIGQATVQPFGPTAVQSGQPFALTSEQMTTVLRSVRHAPGAETFFYIHSDASGQETSFKFGSVRAAAEGVLHQSDFQWGAAVDEAARLTRKDRSSASSPAASYQPAGFAHSHPLADAGKPSGTDLGNLAKIPTATPLVALVFASATMPRASAVAKSATRASSKRDKRMELEASVIWRSAYARAPNGQLIQPHLVPPAPVNYASHRDAVAAMHRISKDLAFRYFAGKIVYDDGRFSSEFVEVR